MSNDTAAPSPTTPYELSLPLARKVLATVDAGLVSGLGQPVPGQMCVEAAVCYAMGLPHSDQPTCVGAAVREAKIALNDASWSSNAARTAGMRALALAQLGSDVLDQWKFAERLTLATVRVIVPLALRAAAGVIPSHAANLEQAAQQCEACTDLVQARAAADNAYAARIATTYAACAAAADAATTYAACAAAADAAAAYAARAAAAAAYAADAAARAAAAAADAAARAAAAAAAADAAAAYAAANAAAANAADSVLRQFADLMLGILIDMGSPGCAYLSLLDEPGETGMVS